MTPMLYILGTSHPLQCGSIKSSTENRAAFEADLRKACASYDVKRIAEEMTNEGLERHGVTHTIGHRVATEMKLSYCWVDLNREERQDLCLDDTPVWTAMENYNVPGGIGAFQQAFAELVDEGGRKGDGGNKK